MGKSETKRDKMIGVWLTAEEHERLRLLAFEAKKPLAAYVRDAALASKKVRR